MPTPIGPETSWFCPSLNPTQAGLPDELLHGYSCVANCTPNSAVWTADTDNGGSWSFIQAGVPGYEFPEILGTPATTNSTGVSIWVKFEATDVENGNSVESIYSASSGSDYLRIEAGFADTGFSQTLKFDIHMVGNGGASGSLSNLSVNNQDTEAAWDAHMTGWHHFFFDASWKRPFDAGTTGDFDPLTNAAPYWKVYMDGEYLGPSNSNPLYSVTSSGSFGAALGADNYTWPSAVQGVNGTTYTWDDCRLFANTMPTEAEITTLASARAVEGSTSAPPVGLGDEYGWWCPSLDANTDGLTNLAGGADATLKLAGQFGVVSDAGSGGTKAWEGTGVGNSGINTGVVPLVDNDFSMSCWFKQDAGASGIQEIMAVEDPSTRDYLQCRVSNGAMSTDFNGLTMSEPTDLRGGWHHVVVTLDYSGNAASQYIDGVLVNSGTMSNGWSQSLGEWEIGSQGRSGTLVWDGLLDDSRVYNRVLTQSEISWLATERGVPGTPPEGLGDEKQWYCAQYNSSAADLGTEGNDGTISGGVTIVDSEGADCFEFDGVDGEIVAPVDTLHGSSDITFSAWVNVTQASTVTGDSAIMGQNNFGVNYQQSTGQITIEKRSSDDALRANADWSTASNDYTQGTGYISPVGDGYDQWLHILATFDSTNLETNVYLNGVNDGTKAFSGNLITNPTMPFKFGVCGLDNNEFARFTGKMDDMRSYTRILSIAEITHLASARGVQGAPEVPTGLGDELLWICPTNTGDISNASLQGTDPVVINGTVNTAADTGESGTLAIDFNKDSMSNYLSWNRGQYNEYTYSWWSKVPSGTTDQGTIFHPSESGVNRGHIQNPRGSSGTIFTHWNDTEVDIYSQVSAADDTWHHCLLYRKEGGSFVSELWLDGYLYSFGTSEGSGTDPSIAGLLKMGIGNDAHTNTQNMLGLVDDVRFFDHKLTRAEIMHLSQQRAVQANPTRVGINFRARISEKEGDAINGNTVSAFSATSATNGYMAYEYSPEDGFGWVKTATGTQGFTRNASNPPEIVGMHWSQTHNDYFRIDLPDGPGTYRIRGCFGDTSSWNQGWSLIDGVSGGTNIADITATNPASGYVDILNDTYTYAQFDANNQAYLEHTFTSGELIINRNTNLNTSISSIQHLSVEKVEGGGPPDPPASVFHNPFTSKTFFPFNNKRIR